MLVTFTSQVNVTLCHLSQDCFGARWDTQRDKILPVMDAPKQSRFKHSLIQFGRLALVMLMFILLVKRSDHKPGDKVYQVRAFTRQVEFDYASWTLDALWVKGEQISLGSVDYIPADEQPQVVLDYLQLVRNIWELEWQINDLYANPDITDPETESQDLREALDDLLAKQDNLAPIAESVFQNQLAAVLGELELSLGGQPVPPVFYHVTPLPLALIVSPRDVIQQDANIGLIPDLTTADRVELEDQVGKALDVSTLVVNIGGVGVYPTMVMETTSINWLAEVVSHEWVHNFLTLRPLGLSYGASTELRIINETTANLAEKEIGRALIARYYPEFLPPEPEETDKSSDEATSPAPEPPAFDFNAEMHETRVTADELLAEGKIEEAEAYMEARRQFFWENGYHIRKLNQAYFAFHGAYADQPGGAAGTTEDPIGEAVRGLRAQSDTLSDFLNRISWMWSWDQLQSAVEPGT